MQKLDGKTTGPNGYTRNIGKQLEDCEKFPICDFATIKTEMLRVFDEAKDQLGSGQKHLYKIVRAVGIRHISERLTNLYPGKMTHSR